VLQTFRASDVLIHLLGVLVVEAIKKPAEAGCVTPGDFY